MVPRIGVTFLYKFVMIKYDFMGRWALKSGGSSSFWVAQLATFKEAVPPPPRGRDTTLSFEFPTHCSVTGCSTTIGACSPGSKGLIRHVV